MAFRWTEMLGVSALWRGVMAPFDIHVSKYMKYIHLWEIHHVQLNALKRL